MTSARWLFAAFLGILIPLSSANTKKNRKIIVTNQCPFPPCRRSRPQVGPAELTDRSRCAGTFTVWPALFTSVGPLPSQDTGWEAKPGTSLTFEVEEGCACPLRLSLLCGSGHRLEHFLTVIVQ